MSQNRQHQFIESAQNAQFKRWRRILQDPGDSENPWIPVEGMKQLSDLSTARSIELLVAATSALENSSHLLARALQICTVPDRLMSRLSRVQSDQGLIGFFQKPRWAWRDMTRFVLYLDAVQDPGNLGTLIRSAAATGIFSLAGSPDTVSFFNDKVVRASVGHLFDVPFLSGIRETELVERGYQLCVCQAAQAPSVFETELQPPLALVLGSEGHGVSERVAGLSTLRVRIPISSSVESLNVSVSGSILMFEILRRKDLHD